MTESRRAAETTDTELRDRLSRLIFGRLGLIVLLLLAFWWRSAGYQALMSGTGPRAGSAEDGLLTFFAVILGLTAVYYAAMRMEGNYLWQARVQFAIDLLSISWLVW